MAKLTKLLVSEKSETDATEENKNDRILLILPLTSTELHSLVQSSIPKRSFLSL